ncbi:MAG: hypothetical protein FJZ01_02745 [Candidatus Sericytochromatia bacterium]|nr:hypothetical protein [Candidatus Tanganyikabacteria bacterium]
MATHVHPQGTTRPRWTKIGLFGRVFLGRRDSCPSETGRSRIAGLLDASLDRQTT